MQFKMPYVYLYMKQTCCVSPGSYEGWEGGSFPCIRVKKNSDSLPRLVVEIMRIFQTINYNLLEISTTISKLSKTKLESKCGDCYDVLHHKPVLVLSVSVSRISVCVRGGETQGPAAGLDGMNLIRDLGAAFFESHCELNDKTSSPFSSNRTMFETEEVR